MCVIVVVPPDKIVSHEDFRDMWDANPDGGGMMWAVDEKLCVFRSLSFQEMYSEYLRVRVTTQAPVVLHFRYATHGTKDLANVHPFEVHPGRLALVHNGIMNYSDKTNRSDTRIFVEEFLRPLPQGFESHDGIMRLVRAVAGQHNKLVMMDNHGSLTQIGAFQVHDGYTVSNRWWEFRSISISTPKGTSTGKLPAQSRDYEEYGNGVVQDDSSEVCPSCNSWIDLYECYDERFDSFVCTQCGERFEVDDSDGDIDVRTDEEVRYAKRH